MFLKKNNLVLTTGFLLGGILPGYTFLGDD
jgi:hypothetical protein